MRVIGSRILKRGTVGFCLAVLAACGGGGGGSDSDGTAGGPPPPAPTPEPPPIVDLVRNELSGSVGDGPVVGGDVKVLDDQGTIVARLESDAFALYSGTIEVSASRYPLLVESRGGTDLVTGGPPDFVLKSAAMRPAVRTIGNINPHSTLIVATALNLAPGPTDNALASARTTVLQQLNFGLDPRQIADPLTSEIDDDNVAVMVVASERLGEVLRRTRDALNGAGIVSADQVIDAFAADLVDGVLDGRGRIGVDDRVAAVSHLVAATVLFESLTNKLQVNGVRASQAMDDAIVQIHPGAAGRTATVGATRQMLSQTTMLLDAAAEFSGDPLIEEAAAAVRELPEDVLPADVEGRLPAGVRASLMATISQAALAGDSELEVINQAVRTAEASQPGIGRFSLDVATASVVEGEFLRLTLRRDTTAGVASVQWRTAPETARAGEDFIGAGGRTVSFAAGEASKTIRVETIDDGVEEDDERFRVELLAPENAELGTPTVVEITLLDASSLPPPPPPSDAGSFTLSAITPIVTEGESVTLTIHRSVANAAASVNWRTVTGSARPGEDYAGEGGRTVNFAVGQTEHRFSVAVFTDGLAEGDEDFGVRLVDPTNGATLGTPSELVITLLDSDPPGEGGYFAPELTSAVVTDEGYVLTWTHPRHAPEGGYDIIADGSVSDVAWRTMGLTATVATLDSTVRHCFRVEARYPSDGEFRLSNELCVEPDPADGIATLSWTPPTQRVDGSVLDNLAGYEVHYGQDETRLNQVIVIDNPGLTSFVVEGLRRGTWHFGMKAVDADGRRSALSNIGSKTFP